MIKGYTWKSRAFTLIELLAAVSLMGTFFLLATPLTIHLITSIHGQNRIQDQLFLVSRIGDKLRSDLNGRQVLNIDPNSLIIGSAEKNIEYRIKNTKNAKIERIESQAAKPINTTAWEIPYSSLKFSLLPGKQDSVLIELHWDLKHPSDRFTRMQSRTLEMSFAAREKEKK